MKHLALILTIIIGTLSSAYAQNYAEPKLSEEDMMDFSERIEQKIEDFQTHLSILCSANSSKQTKKIALEECLKLFIGQGNKYYGLDAYGNQELHDSVAIQITSKINPTHTIPVKRYLTTLTDKLNKRYTKVEITSSQAVRVDNLHETSDGRYECVAYFYQKFRGYKDGKLLYEDITTKKVRVYLDQIEGPVGKTWSIALGDISAVETR
ncbi:MAG: hypothetical protein K2H60_06450 [Muribaculaceae bacterium]|nr:hypothetical protein [Muribaculaceae bacterium]